MISHVTDGCFVVPMEIDLDYCCNHPMAIVGDTLVMLFGYSRDIVGIL